MKKILLATTLAGFLSTSALAAECDMYGRFDVGAVFTSKFDQNSKSAGEYSLSAGLGYKIYDNFRVELNLTHSNLRNKFLPTPTATAYMSAALQSLEVLPKVYYDVLKFDNSSVYLGAGFGYSHQSFGGMQNLPITTNTDLSNSNYVGSGTVGASYDVSENAKLNFAYEYKFYKKVDTYKPKTHNVTLGLQFGF